VTQPGTVLHPEVVGRPSKLTPDVQAVLAKAVGGGLSHSEAAQQLGVSRRTVTRWIVQAQQTKSRLWSMIVAWSRTTQRLPRSRPLARARCEHQVPADVLAALFYQELMETIQDGRVPLDVATNALEMAQDEVRDRLAEESLSFVKNPLARTHPGTRGLSGLGDTESEGEDEL